MKKIYFDEISSTQVYAKEQAKLGIKDEVYITKNQTGGIGRNGHTWFASEGGLYFSFITDNYNDIYTLTVGVAVYKALEELYGIKTQIKWPNDILLNNKKIAGIICEKVKNVIIVGIGINTNFDKEKLKDLVNIATTLKSECKFEIDNDILLDKIIKNINELKNPKEILATFRNNMSFINEKRFIGQLNKEAVIKGIDDLGYLIVSDGNVEYKIIGGIT